MLTTVYDEVAGEYYTRKATEFDGVGDPMENQFQYYYNIINLIDEIALEGRKATVDEIKQLNKWKAKDDALNGECDISDYADANNAGCCEIWEELIEGFKKLWKNGDRVRL